MTQIKETTEGQITSSPDDVLPAVQDAESGQGQEIDASATAFIDTAIEKVQLDIEDAPFLQDEPDEEEEAQTAGGEKPAQVTEDGEEGEEVKPSKKKKIIFLAAGVLLLCILGIVGYFILNYTSSTPPVMQNFITIPSPPEDSQLPFYETTLDPFWVDLENTGYGAKFLVGKFIIRMESEDVQKELGLNIKKVRDAIYYYLVSVDHEFLIDVKNREAVRQGIIDIVNPYLASGQIENVFFDSFLMK